MKMGPLIGISALLLFLLKSKKAGAIAPLKPGMMGQYFSYDEFINSTNVCAAHGIENTATDAQIEAGMMWVFYVGDPLRRCLGSALFVSSWMRDDDCNAETGGVAGSKHLRGDTVDVQYFLGGKRRNDLIMRCLLTQNIPFDKVLIEHGTIEDPQWIHIEFDSSKPVSEQRGRIVRIPGENVISLSQAKQLYT